MINFLVNIYFILCINLNFLIYFSAKIKEFIKTDCAKCTEIQLKNSKFVMRHLINEEPELWEKLWKKFDPERNYIPRYEKELRTMKA